jgi:hypothetical protein
VRPRRVWAVAAIHGEAQRVGALHARLAPCLNAGDRLVYLGNYLGYGSSPAATIDALLLFRRLFLARRNAFPGDIAFLRGSQEEMWQKLLELQFAPNPREVLPWMLEHGLDQTLASYGADAREGMAACREGVLALTRWTASLRAAIEARAGHRQFLSALRRAAFTEDGSLLFVHSGIPVSIQESRSTFRAIISGGASATFSSSTHPSRDSPGLCVVSTVSIRAWSKRLMPHRSMVAAASAGLSWRLALRRAAGWSIASKPKAR